MGAEFEIFMNIFVAMSARHLLLGRHCSIVLTEFLRGFFTSVTHDKRITLFDPENGDKKQIKIMIYPFKIGLVQPAHRTSSGILIKDFYPG